MHIIFGSDGKTLTDQEIVCDVLENWHECKVQKFTKKELLKSVAWIRKKGIEPRGASVKTRIRQ